MTGKRGDNACLNCTRLLSSCVRSDVVAVYGLSEHEKQDDGSAEAFAWGVQV